MNPVSPEEHPPAPAEFSKITDSLYVGTNMCCGTHGEKLMELGATADLDLEENRQELPPHVSAYLWLPVPDHTAPTQEQLDFGVSVLEICLVVFSIYESSTSTVPFSLKLPDSKSFRICLAILQAVL